MEESDQQNTKDDLVLIVDDVPKNIQLLGKILDNNGYRVVAVTKGEQVRSTAEKHRPDLILLDIMMPDKTGYEVCEELKEDEELSDIPVIFLSARSEEEDIVKGLNLGGADYVTKPFRSGELLARIQTHLSLKEARDEIVRQQKEVQELTGTKDKLYSIIAHDLKNALFGISGLAEILHSDLDEKVVNEEIREKIGLINQSSQTATQILENLLAWTRLQSDALNLSPTEFSLSECIEECIGLYKTQASNREVQIDFDAKNTTLYADKEMISTVFRNLLSNAIKFSDAGDEISIIVEAHDKTVEVSVADEGSGMKEEVRKNIFNPAERPKGDSEKQGTGLGLLLCKEFVEIHEGDITVESRPGEGSNFKVRLPKVAVA